MTEAQLLESSVLRDLKRQSEDRGLEFVLHPSGDIIPPFLAGFQPDAIIRRPDGGGIVIEVKRERTRSPDKALVAMAQRVAGQRGWEFRVIYANPSTEMPQQFTEPTDDLIAQRVREVEELAHAGHRVPALILGWAVLEALARAATSDVTPESRRPLSPLQSVQTLTEQGYLESNAASELRALARVRSAAVQGDLSLDVSDEQIAGLLAQLRGIAHQVMRPNA